ncbi:MAG: efflux RND transporter periplasmic adaptor subunit [Pseudomonadota bacterium]|nr:MAG: efflux RND transporter periplasmic adaptor subunit [Pseudomonadota bacterium]
MRKRSGRWLVIVSLLAWSGLGATAELQTAAAAYQTVPKQRVFDATVEAVNQATVSAQINGRIVGIYFDIHDYVPRGKVIISFRDTEQRTQFEVAQAVLREAEVRLSEAQIEFERVEQIYERRLVSKSALDRAKADLQAAKARADSAQAGLQRAEELLGYTEVRAPYAGIVVKRLVEVGESVTVGQPLMAGLSLEQLRYYRRPAAAGHRPAAARSGCNGAAARRRRNWRSPARR